MSVDDFKNYKALVEQPVENFLDKRYKILAPSVPSSGGLVSFIMRVMQGEFNLIQSKTSISIKNNNLLILTTKKRFQFNKRNAKQFKRYQLILSSSS